MNATVLDLLEEPDRLPEMIEEKLLGPDLPALVRELEAIRGSNHASDELPASLLSRIVSDGLVGLSEEEFQSVLSRPRSLLPLQKAVLLEGKKYWDEVLQRVRGGVAPVEPARPWYRSPWAWTANALTGLAASVAFFAVVSGRLDDRDQQLRDRAARNETLSQEFASLKRSHPPVMPADLPEMDLPVAQALDPPDLPENDPEDLPEAPKNRRSSV